MGAWDWRFLAVAAGVVLGVIAISAAGPSSHDPDAAARSATPASPWLWRGLACALMGYLIFMHSTWHTERGAWRDEARVAHQQMTALEQRVEAWTVAAPVARRPWWRRR